MKEIEKAHRDVFNVFLQLMDDGRLTDGQGRTVDFRNTIVVMTSNVGSSLLLDDSLTPEQQKAEMEEVLHRQFKPEFLNRIDEIVHFSRLDEKALKKIVDIQIAALDKRLAERGISLELDNEAKDFLVRQGCDLNFGARPLKRAIQRYVQDELAMEILQGHVTPGHKVKVSVKDDKLRFANA